MNKESVPFEVHLALSKHTEAMKDLCMKLYMALLTNDTLLQLNSAIALKEFMESNSKDYEPPYAVVLMSSGATDTSTINKALPHGTKVYATPTGERVSSFDLSIQKKAHEHYLSWSDRKGWKPLGYFANEQLLKEARLKAHSEIEIPWH